MVEQGIEKVENRVPTKNAPTKVKNERHSRPTLLSNFILGSQDGLVNVLGILLGLTAATTDVRIFFVAALAALGAESISMGAVAYTSTSARRRVYLKEANRETQEMKDVPEIEREEVREIFRRWGYEGNELEDLTEHIVKNPKAMLDLMMSYELDLAPVEKSEARRSAFIVGSSTIFGSFIPLIAISFRWKKYSFRNRSSVIFSGVALFCIQIEGYLCLVFLHLRTSQLPGFMMPLGSSSFLIRIIRLSVSGSIFAMVICCSSILGFHMTPPFSRANSAASSSACLALFIVSGSARLKV